MKKRLLIASMAAISILLAACGNEGTKETNSNDNSIIKDSEIEIELTLENVNDYIDFVSIGKSADSEINQCEDWILLNKQYENDIVYIRSDFTIQYEQTFIGYTTREKESVLCSFDGFESILQSIDKPIIKEVSGTLTLYKGGKAYYDDKEKMREVKFGSHRNGSGGTRAEYFNEYPY